MLRILIDHGADVNALAPDRRIPLFVPVSHGQESTVHLLIERGAGANREIANLKGSTISSRAPLIQALSHGRQPSTVRLLLEKGADIDKAVSGRPATRFRNAINAAVAGGSASQLQIPINGGAVTNWKQALEDCIFQGRI